MAEYHNLLDWGIKIHNHGTPITRITDCLVTALKPFIRSSDAATVATRLETALVFILDNVKPAADQLYATREYPQLGWQPVLLQQNDDGWTVMLPCDLVEGGCDD